MSSDSDWDDIDIVVARDDNKVGAAADPLVAAAVAERENRVLMLLQAPAGDDDSIAKGTSSGTTGLGSGLPAPTNPAALCASLPGRSRSCAFVGAHLHGKSRLVRDLVGRRSRLTPTAAFDSERKLTTTLSVQSRVISGVNTARHSNRAPILFTAADVPGHPNFAAELPPGALIADAAALVVDAVEGVTPSTERALDAIVSEGVPLFLVVSKLDRLLIELRIPPADAYKKLRHIVDSVNVLLRARSAPLVSPCHGTVLFVSSKFQTALTLPIVARRYAEQFGPKVNAEWLSSQLWGNIAFDSATRKFSVLKQQLGGAAAAAKPSFVSFVLEPLYKAMVAALRGTDGALAAAERRAATTTTSDGATASKSSAVSIVNLVKERVATVFGSYSENLPDAFLEAMDQSQQQRQQQQQQQQHAAATSSSSASSTSSLKSTYVAGLLQSLFGMSDPVAAQWSSLQGVQGAQVREQLQSSPDMAAPFGVLAAKTRLEVESASASSAASGAAAAAAATTVSVGNRKVLARTFAVMKLVSGKLQLKEPVSVYAGPDAEVRQLCPRMMLLLLSDNTLVPVQHVAAGAVVLVDFSDAAADSSGNNNTTVMSDLIAPALVIPSQRAPITDELLPITRRHDIAALYAKVAIEPANIKELGLLRNVVATICAERAGVDFSVDDTGDLVLSTAGEVQLDAVLFDVRRHCSIRVTAPFTALSETVVAEPQGVLRRHTEQNVAQVQELQLSAFAMPLGKEASAAVARGIFHNTRASTPASFGARHLALNTMRHECGWDLVDCDTFVDALGESCVLFSDSKEHASSSSSSSSALSNNVHRWAAFGATTAVRRGPLCDEPIRGVGFTLVDILHRGETLYSLSSSGSNNNSSSPSAVIQQGTTTACARNVIRKAFISAAPRLLEPVMQVHITLPQARVSEMAEMLRRRRGSILQEIPVPATTWTVLKGLLPLADSFGFETAVRVGTQGDAYPVLQFSEWSLVPGDPLDASVRVNPYEAASGVLLARDFVTKTRKRKGLSDKIDLN